MLSLAAGGVYVKAAVTFFACSLIMGAGDVFVYGSIVVGFIALIKISASSCQNVYIRLVTVYGEIVMTKNTSTTTTNTKKTSTTDKTFEIIADYVASCLFTKKDKTNESSKTRQQSTTRTNTRGGR